MRVEVIAFVAALVGLLAALRRRTHVLRAPLGGIFLERHETPRAQVADRAYGIGDGGFRS